MPFKFKYLMLFTFSTPTKRRKRGQNSKPYCNYEHFFLTKIGKLN